MPGTTRIAIANSNVPNMVGQISTLLASASINIADLLNKSRAEYAYTLIDTDGEIGEPLVERLRQINGVLSARIVRQQV
jgi:D-3-phosphoglycerate dehydrogenase